MKNKFKVTAATAAMILAMSGSAPAFAETATATSKASIVKTLSLTKDSDMDFGTVIMVPGQSGWAMLDFSNGTRFCTHGCIGAHSFGDFTIEGSDGPVTVNFPWTITATGPSTDVYIDLQFPTAPGQPVTVVNGTANLRFGAFLHWTAASIPGAYESSFTVDVDYQ